MGQLDKYRIFNRTTKVKLDTVPVLLDKPKTVIAEVYLEPTVQEITRSNSVPGVSDYLTHNIAEYRREDTSVRLLPSSDILLDRLIERVVEVKQPLL